MDTQRCDAPPWLVPLVLQNQNFERTCHIHDKYNARFCTVCMKDPICEDCWEGSSSEHEGHEVLRVFRSSRRTALKQEDISKLWLDFSGIQPFTMNGNSVLYVESDVKNMKPNTFGCEVCHKRLKDGPKYSFCSIGCKLRSMNNMIHGEPFDGDYLSSLSSLIEQVMHQTATSSSSNSTKEAMNIAELPPINNNQEDPTLDAATSTGDSGEERVLPSTPNRIESFRIRSRKGMPQRSPC